MFGGPSGNLPSANNHKFSEVPEANIQRSTFNRSHGLKTTFDAGYLVPIYFDEAYPGDTFTMNAKAFGRLSTPIHPIFDNLKVNTYFFAVPLRLLWDNFEKMMGEQDNPTDSIDYLCPQIVNANIVNSTLYDYFGIPTQIANTTFNNFAGRCYNLIYNEWFRDENLQDSVVVDKDDGPDDIADYVLLKKNKTHDFFTSQLPWPQKGDAVQLPLGSSAPVLGIYHNPVDVSTAAVNYIDYNSASWNTVGLPQRGTSAEQFLDVLTDGTPQVYADLSEAVGATVNELRESFAIQHLLEANARFGSRYTEIILGHFGVHSADSRLQRPEYIGGGYSNLQMDPIPQTSSTDTTTPQGNLSAQSYVSLSQGHNFTKSFTEHSVVIGMACVTADLTYQQGLNRMFQRRDRWDFYWPALANIGEQATKNSELYYQGTSADDNTFGYQEAWAELRYKPSQITGRFRSNYAQTLDSWHLSQEFSSLPVLNSSFIQENPPIDRVVAVTTEPDLIMDWYFDYVCTRPMPVYSIPGLQRL